MGNVMEEWEEHKDPDQRCERMDNCPFRGEGRPSVEKIYM